MGRTPSTRIEAASNSLGVLCWPGALDRLVREGVVSGGNPPGPRGLLQRTAHGPQAREGSARPASLALLPQLPPLRCGWEGALSQGHTSASRDGSNAVCLRPLSGRGSPLRSALRWWSAWGPAGGSVQVPGGSARYAGQGAIQASSSGASWLVSSRAIPNLATPPAKPRGVSSGQECPGFRSGGIGEGGASGRNLLPPRQSSLFAARLALQFGTRLSEQA